VLRTVLALPPRRCCSRGGLQIFGTLTLQDHQVPYLYIYSLASARACQISGNIHKATQSSTCTVNACALDYVPAHASGLTDSSTDGTQRGHGGQRAGLCCNLHLEPRNEAHPADFTNSAARAAWGQCRLLPPLAPGPVMVMRRQGDAGVHRIEKLGGADPRTALGQLQHSGVRSPDHLKDNHTLNSSHRCCAWQFACAPSPSVSHEQHSALPPLNCDAL